MPEAVRAVVARLFQEEKPGGAQCRFSWHLIQRRHRPFLLLPTAPASPWVSLALYSAHRRRAKIWRAALPLMLKTPAALIFRRVNLRLGGGSHFLRFLSDQSGVPVGLLPAPAIKFGGQANRMSRLVLLVCDQTSRPIKVVKLGLDTAGRAATEREADLLEKLPAHRLGCIRLTGRLTTANLSAFATDFFAGDSPENDLGMEILFHAWINPGPPVPLESLETWRELETEAAAAAPAQWQALRLALAGRHIHTTLHHGDFAPWNIRAVNSMQLQVFDWERGRLQGIPGWDWFHFVVQSSILARRHSVERVAAELEELLASPRFQNYAQVTGIRPIVQPLVLAYLCHNRCVIKPREGITQLNELSDLLFVRWGFSPRLPAHEKSLSPASPPAAISGPAGLWADAHAQLKLASQQLANVFWEPELTAPVKISRWDELKSSWSLLLLCAIWILAAALVQYYLVNHVLLLPVFAAPCLLVGWRISRGWGTIFAAVAAVAGPLVAAAKEPGTRSIDLTCWNILMRFAVLEISVFLADRIHREEGFFDELTAPRRRKADFRRHWAIFAFSTIWFLLIAWGDLWTGPRVSFLPLYLFPAILLTLFLNLGWGALAALLGALVTSIDEYSSAYDPNPVKVFAWNFPMRFLMLFLVIVLLNRLRHDNVLFGSKTVDRRFDSDSRSQASQI